MGRHSWIVKLILSAIAASVMFTFLASAALDGAGYISAMLALLFFILLGVVFDIVGVAVTAAREAPFHAMAAHKRRGAREAITLIRSANKVSSVCNDVVGDIAGIISGSTSALLVARIHGDFNIGELTASLLIAGAVTALTVGGKAVGKSLAMTKSGEIIYGVGRVVSFFRGRMK
ncbi:MAG: hypothetical protein LBC78_01910 [Oscillospiraceae bacterium]|nr:hypothetical protein [Oscillospiraceae bacterium]